MKIALDPDLPVIAPAQWNRESPATRAYNLRMQEDTHEKLLALAEAYGMAKAQVLQALIIREYEDVFTPTKMEK